MANLKVELEKDETPDQAEELILKAFLAQRDGSTHNNDYHDPAMRDLLARMVELHEENFQALLAEIKEILAAEYEDGNLR